MQHLSEPPRTAHAPRTRRALSAVAMLAVAALSASGGAEASPWRARLPFPNRDPYPLASARFDDHLASPLALLPLHTPLLPLQFQLPTDAPSLTSHRHRRLGGDEWCQEQHPAGNHTLTGDSPPCVLTTQVTVGLGTELQLKTRSSARTSAIISGDGVTRLFFVNGGTLVLSYIILEAGIAPHGGAVAVTKGGSLCVRGGALVVIRTSAAVDANGLGGGVLLHDTNSMLRVSGGGTRFRFEKNSANKAGAGVCLHDGTKAVVETGAVLEFANNSAVDYGGGLYLRGSTTRFTVTDSTSQLRVEGNTAGSIGGGLVSIDGANVLVETGATVLITNNEASRGSSGGVFLRREHNSSCLGRGGWRCGSKGIRLVQTGGFCSTSGANVLVETGAVLRVEGNTAGSNGGGFYSISGANVLVETGAVLRVEGNTAGSIGGGLVSIDAANLLVETGARVCQQRGQ